MANEFAKVKANKQQISFEIENYFLPEYQLFGAPFVSKFTLPKLDFSSMIAPINANLEQITKRVFNPMVEIGRPSFNKTHNCPNKSFNKFFEDLGSNKLSVLAFPLEALFITLSKLQWNETLRTAKIKKIAQMCFLISKSDKHTFFEKDEDTLRVLNEQKVLNLQNISKIYSELFQELQTEPS